MRPTGLHLLLSYQCTLECDHCFVWGSPRQQGTMTLAAVAAILRQAADLGSVRSIYFEGGEPFLYYATLLAGARLARDAGFSVGIVTNGYWATSAADAEAALRPFAGLLDDLSVSSDAYHGAGDAARAEHLRSAAQALGIPGGVIRIAAPEAAGAEGLGQIPAGESGVMFRGRAAQTLAPRVAGRPWERFDACPHEDLRAPDRLHVDPLGYLHLCQGLVIGNLFDRPLASLCAAYRPDAHPIAGPLLAGGPAELVRRHHLPHAAAYADACHLCDQARHALRAQFPTSLAPEQMYGLSAA